MKISLNKSHIKSTTKLGPLHKFKQHFPPNMKFHHQDMYNMGDGRIQHSLYFNNYGLGGYGWYPYAYMNVTRNINDPDMDGDIDITPAQGTANFGTGGTIDVGVGDPPSAG